MAPAKAEPRGVSWACFCVAMVCAGEESVQQQEGRARCGF